MLDTSKWIYEDLKHGLNAFSTIAFDGRFFYFADGENIYVYSKDFVPINCIKAAPKIAALCYDNSDDCFWAADGKAGEILRLSRRFEETGRLSLNCGAIFGLSYFCAHDTLLVCARNSVIEACKHGEQREVHAISGWANITSAAPFFALLQDKHDGQVIYFYTPDNIHSILEVPPGYIVKDILFYPPENQLLALAQSKNRTKILRHPMPCIDICCCNYAFNDFCDEHCKWLVANVSCGSDWGNSLM